MRINPNLKVGSRIRLDRMDHDPDPIEPGAMGTVQGVTDMIAWVQIQVLWDDGRTLSLSVPPDAFTIVPGP